MTKPNASILDFSKAPEGIDWGMGLGVPRSGPKYYAVEIGGFVALGFTAQEAFDKALAEYERMLEQEAGA